MVDVDTPNRKWGRMAIFEQEQNGITSKHNWVDDGDYGNSLYEEERERTVGLQLAV